MLAASTAPLFTPRLELRRTRVADAAAMFEALCDPAIYTFVPRAPPKTAEELAARCARVIAETAPGRAEQWLNWTVWLRETGAPLGMVEATVNPAHTVAVAYLFDPRVQRRGYAREATAAMITHLAAQGACAFEATIDVRNTRSRALVAALGFAHVHTSGIDETWRLHPARP